ncbi:inhibin beta B chain-like [Protopterus annectens]|uniref:inhibin beta B chain-like n=1 Tax=Protopterus annectens TaxID=7888 RepID=UPI001CFA5932|nr:inhibin beta B chain-like [Protopterus annectens]
MMIPSSPRTVLFLFTAVSMTSAQSNKGFGCRSCGMPTLKPGTENEVLIEAAKQHVLSKLHIKERPRIAYPLSRAALLIALAKLQKGKVKQDEALGQLYDSVKQAVIPQVEEEGYEFVTFEEPGSSSARLNFSFSKDKRKHVKIMQSNLWLFIVSPNDCLKKLTLTAFLDMPSKETQTLISKKQFNIKAEGWQTFPVSDSVQGFFDRGDKGLVFEIEQDGCLGTQNFINVNESHRPFLVTQARTHKHDHQLQKRGLDCDQNSNNCCKRDFYVSFKAIGWNDWIMVPDGFHMNYCTGLCPMHLAGTPGVAVSTFAYVSSLIRANKQTFVTSCCVPKVTKPLSMLYFDENRTIVKKDIPNMIIEACGCT